MARHDGFGASGFERIGWWGARSGDLVAEAGRISARRGAQRHTFMARLWRSAWFAWVAPPAPTRAARVKRAAALVASAPLVPVAVPFEILLLVLVLVRATGRGNNAYGLVARLAGEPAPDALARLGR